VSPVVSGSAVGKAGRDVRPFLYFRHALLLRLRRAGSLSGFVHREVRGSHERDNPLGHRNHGAGGHDVKLGEKELVTRTNFGTEEAYAALMTLVPYGRIGEPED